jgi:hypothetical protein
MSSGAAAPGTLHLISQLLLGTAPQCALRAMITSPSDSDI